MVIGIFLLLVVLLKLKVKMEFEKFRKNYAVLMWWRGRRRLMGGTGDR